LRRLYELAFSVVHVIFLSRLNLLRNARRTERKLEIGPGSARLPGFETLNIVGSPNVDYVCDATRQLPFKDGTFRTIYASHVLEHAPWYLTEEVLKEWVRILSVDGCLEIWVPDGLKIARAFVEAETMDSKEYRKDDWWRFNEIRDPCRWVNGRLFSYGDGTGRRGHYNWHLATFSYRYLELLLGRAGLSGIEQLERSLVRGYDHGWINLGIRGWKRRN
jgi:SAM-dependent methyltransferase